MRPATPARAGLPSGSTPTGAALTTLRRWRNTVDLLCLMTYDQNTRWTMPGPVAGWDWTVENLNYALKTVPKEKLSLGIPLYGYHWYAGAPTRGCGDGRG